MTCAELCCQIVGEHFPQLCENFSLEGGNWVVCISLDNVYIDGFADLYTCKNWCNETYFLDSGSPRGEGFFACVGMVCCHCIVHNILNSSKKLYFFVSNSNLCRAMLPNYLRTYSSALCQIRALEKAFKSKTMAKVYQNHGFWMHLIGQNKHSKFTCNTLHILPETMTCAELCWPTYLGTYSSAFCHIWALKKAFEKSNKCQR